MQNARPWPGALLAVLSLVAPLVALVGATASCDGSAQFNANYAPGFTPASAPAKVSILGVFRDGRLSPETWLILGAPISAPLGGAPLCDVGFGEKLQGVNPELYGRIDENVRSNGITDELLAQLAPKTDGELLVTVSVLGRVELARLAAEAPEAPSGVGARNAPVGGGHTRGRTRGGSGHKVAFSGLELSASMFSVKLHRSVGRLSMRYSGTNLEEALRLFAVRLGAELPGATCRPWSWGEPPPP
jgi:hypothetical protein